MSNAFSILPASTAIPLDAAGKGSASFTVSNQTGRALRVRVSVTAAGETPTPRDWLTPPEVAERELAADGSQQFTVMVHVPARSAAGTYTFRLDAVSVELPDEEWAHSPLVHFVVPEPEPEPEEPVEPPPPPKGYVETAAGALLGGFAGGLGAALIGLLALIVATGLPTGTGTGDAFQDFLNSLGTVILLVVVAVALTALGLWIGTAVGVFLFLRARGFAEPGRTALPTAVLLPIWAIAVFFLVSLLPDDIDLPGLISFIGLLVLAAIVSVVPAVAGRAIFRFRTTGGL